MDIHGYSSSVLVNGRRVKEYRHNGLTFIEAKNGTEFAVEVKNHLSCRVLAIVSVDGLDIVDGKPATNKSRGYIINGNDSVSLHGWRKSDTEIGAFQFTSSEKSYATEKGKGQNNGVIAVKLIAEKVKAYVPPLRPIIPFHPQPVDNDPWIFPNPKSPFRPRPYYTLDDTGTFGGGNLLRSVGPTYGACGMSAGASMKLDSGPVAQSFCASVDMEATEKASFDMGTTWGGKREDKVTTTEFEYGNEIGNFTFYYASREALKAMGVPLVNERQVVKLPQAFESGGYAQPPKNWRA